MEVKIKLDWRELNGLIQMLESGIQHHRAMAISLRNSTECVEQIMHAEVMDQLHEKIVIKAKRSDTKRVYQLMIKLSHSDCHTIMNGYLPRQNDNFYSAIKYKLTQAIQRECHESISYYYSQLSPTKFIG